MRSSTVAERTAIAAVAKRAEIPASEPEVSDFTEVSSNLDRQLLKLINPMSGSPG